jgi:hypothetical protein
MCLQNTVNNKSGKKVFDGMPKFYVEKYALQLPIHFTHAVKMNG